MCMGWFFELDTPMTFFGFRPGFEVLGNFFIGEFLKLHGFNSYQAKYFGIFRASIRFSEFLWKTRHYE